MVVVELLIPHREHPMFRFRPSLSTRWLVLSLLTLQVGFLPTSVMACACGSGIESCCAEPTPDACCCSDGGCCDVKPIAAGCCATDSVAMSCGLVGNCACCSAPARPASPTVPTQPSAEKEISAAVAAPAIAHLPVVVPTLHDGCQLPSFGPPARGPTIQIAFCIWRN